MALHFEQPLWLAAIPAALAVSVWFALWQARKQSHALKTFFEQEDSLKNNLVRGVSLWRRSLKQALCALALCGLLFTLARPTYGEHTQTIHAKGIDIMVALDTSRSMLAEDMRPNRLERAKIALRGLRQHLGSDRLGLVIFAGSAFLQCPLTFDYDAFEMTLQNVDTNLIPVGGSDLSAAIAEAAQAFDEQNSAKALILITDGEDHSADALARAEEAASKGLTLYSVGVGTRAGALIPLQDRTGQRYYARDEQGDIVTTYLVSEPLENLAQSTGGFYRELENDPNALSTIYEAIRQNIPPQQREDTTHTTRIQRYAWVLLPVFALLFIEPLIRARRKHAHSSTHAWVLGFALALGATTSPQQAHAQDLALEAYQRGEFTQAAEHYQAQTPKADTQYNLGSALYKAQEYEAAAQAFAQAITRSDSATVQAKAFYNLGTLKARLGEQSLSKDPQQTIKHWENALIQYDNALELTPDDSHAQDNRAAVSAALEALKQQLQPQEQPEQSDSEEDDSDQSSDASDSPQEQPQDSSGNQSQDSQGSQPDSSGEQNTPQNQPNDSTGQAQDSNTSQSQSEQGQPQEPQPSEGTPSEQSTQSQTPEPDNSAQSPQAPKPEAARPAPEPNAGEDDPQPSTPLNPQSQSDKPETPKPNASPSAASAKDSTAEGTPEEAGGLSRAQALEQAGYMSQAEAEKLLESAGQNPRLLPFIGYGTASEEKSPASKNW